MNRRDFQLALASLVAAPLPARAQGDWAALERESGGRLGVAIMQADGRLAGWRLDERFPMCSTFKWLAAAHVLHRVGQGVERLERRISYERDALRPHSPVTEQHVGAGMMLAQLCQATITVSDNAAANLILATYGGPEGLTRYARSLGDDVTRLDRWETEMSEGRPGDPRDTTSPRAMARLLHTAVLGQALAPPHREQLVRWLQATETNTTRLKADLPPGWRLGSKTGSGGFGSTNDVGVFWPPDGPPVVVAVYLTATQADAKVRNGTIAQVARRVTRG